MKPSRYATTPSRQSPRYAKQTGSRDSRISSRYAMKTFDRPSRYAKAMQIKIFIKLNPIHSVRFLHISSDFLLIFSTLNLCQTCSKPLVTLLEVFPSSLASLKTLELGEEARRIEVTIHAPNHHHQKLLLLNLIVKELLRMLDVSLIELLDDLAMIWCTCHKRKLLCCKSWICDDLDMLDMSRCC
ncbi:hypothetical protein E3N88_34647 [Mikania micrantha]|uniref:Uncharacterized protein n=1 Tax=Mikania micrantha TaxID=192012 RepID=A0A5N6LYR5_9ASTR|nr:hypothetical protein E3N88_34647 [Mikania micrantha]